MLQVSNIEEFIQRLGVEEFNPQLVAKSSHGDFIEVFDPDLDFDEVKSRADSYRPVYSRITDSGVDFFQVKDTIFVDGERTKVSYLVIRGENKFGTSAKILVNQVESYVGGELRVFLGFEDKEQYISRMVAE